MAKDPVIPEQEEVISKIPDLHKPLAFYGSYVHLSENQKERVAEEVLCMYYRAVIDDLMEAIDHLKHQCEEAKFQMTEGATHIRKLKMEKEQLEKDLQELHFNHTKEILVMNTKIIYWKT